MPGVKRNGLTFTIESAKAVPFAAVPSIAFSLQIVNSEPTKNIQSISLRAQIMLEASRRRYASEERESLRDLFGEPERWSKTLQSMLWTHASVSVQSFTESTSVDLPVPCTFDFNVGAAKYFHAVQNSDVPLCFQFSGTIFYRSPEGSLQIEQIGWDKEARFPLPALVWREMMDHYYPNSAWLRLRRDTFERLYEYKRMQGLATWEEALELLLQTQVETPC